MYSLAIFDLDGTLLNTIDDLAAAGNYTLSLLNYPTHTVDAFKRFVGNGIPNLIHRMLPENHTEEEHSRAYRIFSDYYSEHKSDLTYPYEGICELVEYLDKIGVSCCVNTNKSQEFAQELINKFFGKHIKTVVGQGGGYPLKPSPDAAIALCEKYGTDKSKAIYIGDSEVDIKTARNANISCCSVLWGFREKEELSACKPDFIANNIEELKKLF